MSRLHMTFPSCQNPSKVILVPLSLPWKNRQHSVSCQSDCRSTCLHTLVRQESLRSNPDVDGTNKNVSTLGHKMNVLEV
jgi:hypothetical protein